jgi:hypothetical protein
MIRTFCVSRHKHFFYKSSKTILKGRKHKVVKKILYISYIHINDIVDVFYQRTVERFFFR